MQSIKGVENNIMQISVKSSEQKHWILDGIYSIVNNYCVYFNITLNVGYNFQIDNIQ